MQIITREQFDVLAATARTKTAIERVRATKAGAFARQARECWADSTPQQRRQMTDLIRHAWRNHTAGRRTCRGID